MTVVGDIKENSSYKGMQKHAWNRGSGGACSDIIDLSPIARPKT